MPGALGTIRAVLRLPSLRRLIPAFLAFSVAEWASWIGVVVYAYSRGGPAEAGHRGRRGVHPVDHRGASGIDVRRPAAAHAGPRRGLCHPRALDGGDRGGARGRSPIRGVRDGDRRRDEHHARPPGAWRAPPRGRAEAGRAGGRERGVGNGRGARRAPRSALGRAADRGWPVRPRSTVPTRCWRSAPLPPSCRLLVVRCPSSRHRPPERRASSPSSARACGRCSATAGCSPSWRS